MSSSIQDIMARIEASRATAAKAANEERLVLATAMSSAGVERVEIDFAGGGDSGSVEDVRVFMAAGYTAPDGLKDELTNWAYKYLEGTGVDWYNNDGGQGCIEFDLTTAPHQFRANVDINYMNSETAWKEEGAV